MKRRLVILLGLILAAGCEVDYEEQADAGAGVELEEDSFAAVDADANGLISEEEAEAHEALADNFDQADTNGSGYVNRSEFEEALGSQSLQE